MFSESGTPYMKSPEDELLSLGQKIPVETTHRKQEMAEEASRNFI